MARKFPATISNIAEAGHEISCHGDHHITLNQLEPSAFAADLRANRDAIESTGAPRPTGFRAPIFSMTKQSSWAYRVLDDEGFVYSSSVLPASNPLFGWPEFGTEIRRVDGIIELPVTLASVLGYSLPLFGGTYFRVLPYWLVQREFRNAIASRPVLAYFHPYDVDSSQPWSMNAGVNGNLFLNSLLFLRRRSLIPRLMRLLSQSSARQTYSEFVARFKPGALP
jgi:peptidoglycan/xylan/chitin deacetylase (PgdA/CDA1 family)